MRDFLGQSLQSPDGKIPLKLFLCSFTWDSLSTFEMMSRLRFKFLSSSSMEEASDPRVVMVEWLSCSFWRTARSRNGWRAGSRVAEEVALLLLSERLVPDSSMAVSRMSSRSDSRASTRNMLSCSPFYLSVVTLKTFLSSG